MKRTLRLGLVLSAIFLVAIIGSYVLLGPTRGSAYDTCILSDADHVAISGYEYSADLSIWPLGLRCNYLRPEGVVTVVKPWTAGEYAFLVVVSGLAGMIVAIAFRFVMPRTRRFSGARIRGEDRTAAHADMTDPPRPRAW